MAPFKAIFALTFASALFKSAELGNGIVVSRSWKVFAADLNRRTIEGYKPISIDPFVRGEVDKSGLPGYAAIIHLGNESSRWAFSYRPIFGGLQALVRNNEEHQYRDYAMSRAVAYSSVGGKLTFSALYDHAPGVKSRVMYLDGSADSTAIVRRERGRLVSLFAFEWQGRMRHLAVWNSDRGQWPEQKVHYNLPIEQLRPINDDYVSRGFAMTDLQFANGPDGIVVVAIWHRIPHLESYYIIARIDALNDGGGPLRPGFEPSKISHFINRENKHRFAILYNNYGAAQAQMPYTYPRLDPLWADREIPKTYLAGSQQGFDPADLAKMDAIVHSYMQKYDIPSISLGFVKDEQLKLAVAYGLADIGANTVATPRQINRVGSVSKAITSVAIFKAAEMGLLRLDDRVFGEGALLGHIYGTHRYSHNLIHITVGHLLEHTGAWGDSGASFDAHTYELDDAAFLSYLIDHYPVRWLPGTHYAYSNEGFFTLGIVLAHVSGQSYEDFVKEHVFAEVGAHSPRLANLSLAGRYADEVVYYLNGSGDNYSLPPKGHISSAGAWTLTAVDMLRLMVRVDGFGRKPDILSASSLREMTRPTTASGGIYAKGWQIGFDGWTGYGHAGLIAGALAFMQRADDGVEYACAINGQTQLVDNVALLPDIIKMGTQIATNITHWPPHDLF